MTEPGDVVSPDDTGSDTFARFKYQAHATFPYCLRLAQGDRVTGVFAEHVEDIAVREAGSWRFLQVKSRDAGRGPWTFAEIVRSGAFRSLWRAYGAAGPSVEATYEVCLEGAVKNDDVLSAVVENGEFDDDCLHRLASDLGVAVEDIGNFAGRLCVRPLPPLGSIVPENLRLLGKAAPGVSMGEIERTYRDAMTAIEAAMTGVRLEGNWPAALFLAPDERSQLRLEVKRIGRERAEQIFGPILRDGAMPPPGLLKRAPFILPQIDVPTFTGRSAELKRLESILLHTNGEKISSIAGVSGTGGLGKTALACHFAELHRSQFSDGVIGLRVDGKEPITVARDFVRSAWVELDPDDDRDASTLMQEVFRERCALLIFDNTRNAAILSLLPGGTRCAVIITTRDRLLPAALGLPDDAHLDVSPLAADDAVRLLDTLLRERVGAEPDAAAQICALIGNLPLAIQIVGATLRMQPWRSLIEFEAGLREERDRLAMLSVPGDSQLDLRASLSISLNLLGSSESAFFACLGVCAPDGFSVVSASAANGCDVPTAQNHLAILFRLCLVNRGSKANQFVLHPLLRLLAREQAEQFGLSAVAEARHRDFFRALVMRQDVDDPAVATFLAPEVDDILAAAESLERAGLLDTEFLIRIEPLFKRHGYWLNKFGGLLLREEETPEALLSPPSSVKIHDDVREERADASELQVQAELLQRQGDFEGAFEALTRAFHLAALRGDLQTQDTIYRNFGGILQHLGRFDETIDVLRNSQAMWETVGDRRNVVMVLNNLGGALQRQGKFHEAEDVLRRACEGSMSLGDLHVEAVVLNSLGGVLQRQGKFDEAVEVFRRSHAISEKLGDQRSVAMVLNSLGGVLQRLGKFDEAVDALRRSVAIAETLGDTRHLAMVLNSLGGVLQRLRKLDEAVDVFRTSHAISEKLGDKRNVGMVLNSLGGVLQRQGKFDEAVDVLRRSYELEVELADSRGQAMVLNSLASVLQRQMRYDEAVDAFSRSRTLLAELGDSRGEAMVLHSLGGVLRRKGKLDEAVDAFRRSYAISEQMNDKRSVAMVLNSLGGVLQRQGKFDEAVDTFRRGYAISEDLDDKRSEAMVLNSLGGVLQRQGKLDEAVDALRRSYELELALGDLRGQAMLLNSLGGVLQRQGKFDEAYDAFRGSIAIGEKLDDRRHLAMVHTAYGRALLKFDRESAIRELGLGFEFDAALRNRRGVGIVAPILIETLMKMGRRAEALEICERALAIAPGDQRLLRLKADLDPRSK